MNPLQETYHWKNITRINKIFIHKTKTHSQVDYIEDFWLYLGFSI